MFLTYIPHEQFAHEGVRVSFQSAGPLRAVLGISPRVAVRLKKTFCSLLESLLGSLFRAQQAGGGFALCDGVNPLTWLDCVLSPANRVHGSTQTDGLKSVVNKKCPELKADCRLWKRLFQWHARLWMSQNPQLKK